MWRARSTDADDESAGGGFDDVVGDGVEFVDLQDALDLGEESFQEPEVTSGDPGDGGDGLGVGEVLWVEGLSGRAPVSSPAARPCRAPSTARAKRSGSRAITAAAPITTAHSTP